LDYLLRDKSRSLDIGVRDCVYWLIFVQFINDKQKRETSTMLLVFCYYNLHTHIKRKSAWETRENYSYDWNI